MRLFAGVTLLGIVLAGEASASSFAVLDAPARTPSFVALGAPAVTEQVDTTATSQIAVSPKPILTSPQTRAETRLPVIRTISQSVIAMGDPPLAISHEAVAAIGDARKSLGQAPRVIRGGVDGGLAPVSEASNEAPGDQKLSRPQQRKLERDRRRAIREGEMAGEPPPQDTPQQAATSASPPPTPAAAGPPPAEVR